MEMKASCQFDLESAKALVYSRAFKKKNPKVGIVLMTIAASVGVTYGTVFSLIAGGISFEVILFLLFMVSTYLFMCYTYFVLPKKILKRSSGHRREYVFCDDGFTVTDPDDATYSKEVAYDTLIAGWETAQYLFIQQAKNVVFVVNKSTFTGGTIEDIRAVLCGAVGDNYSIYSY